MTTSVTTLIGPPEPVTPLLSVVTPCLNEAAGLDAYHRAVGDAAHRAVGPAYEIVLIDDGSTDDTFAAMCRLADRDDRVVAIRLSRNFGHQKALSAGLHACRGDRVLVIDADLQDPPALLPALMAALDRGADVAYGQRRARSGETVFKTVSAALFYRVLRRLTDIEIPLDAGDFRLMTRRTVDVFKGMPEQFLFIRGMISWIGLRQEAVPYDRLPREFGHTGYTLRRMVAFALDAVTGFSIVPLRFVTWVGLASSAASVLLALYAVVRWLAGGTVEGWTSLACIVLLLGGMQLLFLGVLGEYVGRIYIEQKRRPTYVVSALYRGGEPMPDLSDRS